MSSTPWRLSGRFVVIEDPWPHRPQGRKCPDCQCCNRRRKHAPVLVSGRSSDATKCPTRNPQRRPTGAASIGIAAQCSGLERPGLADFVAVDVSEFALAQRVSLRSPKFEALVLAIFERGHDVTAVERLAGSDRTAQGPPGTDLGNVGKGVDRHTVDFGVGDDVDDARDGVRTVNRRRTFTQDLDPLDDRGRQAC